MSSNRITSEYTDEPRLKSMIPSGVAILYTPQELLAYGYPSMDPIYESVILFYRPKKTSASKWYKKPREDRFDILFEYQIKENLSLEEGITKYPEVFL